ncbi:hypothetical protein HPB48_007624 [Haemaphysalis longicornis]|uniref:Uncharacterized protein n=1 Tax=Haemaphysalis longicornis TaxID=44386 RepID=A0A9J6G4P2_HAELO|nr:hypothetical protein HPB48_007624 [Haemaphysalis longicornis]
MVPLVTPLHLSSCKAACTRLPAVSTVLDSADRGINAQRRKAGEEEMFAAHTQTKDPVARTTTSTEEWTVFHPARVKSRRVEAQLFSSTLFRGLARWSSSRLERVYSVCVAFASARLWATGTGDLVIHTGIRFKPPRAWRTKLALADGGRTGFFSGGLQLSSKPLPPPISIDIDHGTTKQKGRKRACGLLLQGALHLEGTRINLLERHV